MRILVANAEAAAGVDKVDIQAVVGQLAHQGQHSLHGFAEGLDVGDLRADVDADAHRVQVGVGCGLAIQLASPCDGHAELMLAQPGADVGMGLWPARRG